MYAAKHEGLDSVDDALRGILTEGKPLRVNDVLALVAVQQRSPAPIIELSKVKSYRLDEAEKHNLQSNESDIGSKQ